MESSLIRLVRRLFATTPRVYLATLKILQRGSPEKRLYISILRKGDVVIDAGANVGYFTMLFSDLVGAYGHVHAFEPVPATFSLLSENVRRFPHYANVSLNCAALGRQRPENEDFPSKWRPRTSGSSLSSGWLLEKRQGRADRH